MLVFSTSSLTNTRSILSLQFQVLSLRVTLPKPIVEYLKIQEGDTVSIYADDHRVIVEPKKDDNTVKP